MRCESWASAGHCAPTSRNPSLLICSGLLCCPISIIDSAGRRDGRRSATSGGSSGLRRRHSLLHDSYAARRPVNAEGDNALLTDQLVCSEAVSFLAHSCGCEPAKTPRLYSPGPIFASTHQARQALRVGTRLPAPRTFARLILIWLTARRQPRLQSLRRQSTTPFAAPEVQCPSSAREKSDRR